jgi:hypothetical protein
MRAVVAALWTKPIKQTITALCNFVRVILPLTVSLVHCCSLHSVCLEAEVLGTLLLYCELPLCNWDQMMRHVVMWDRKSGTGRAGEASYLFRVSSGVGGSNEREQGGRQQLRSLGGHKTRAMQNSGSFPAKTCSGFSSLPLVGIRSCN